MGEIWWMGNTLSDHISVYIQNCIYIQDFYSGNKMIWKFSILYDSGIIDVYIFMLSWDYGHWGQTHYYKYIQNKLTKKYIYGAKRTSPPKRGEFTIGKENSSLLSYKCKHVYLSYIDKRGMSK